MIGPSGTLELPKIPVPPSQPDQRVDDQAVRESRSAASKTALFTSIPTRPPWPSHRPNSQRRPGSVSYRDQLTPKIPLIRRAAANWNDAKRRVLASYREWIRAVC